MSNNHINYAVEVCEENAQLIDAMNQLMLGGTTASTSTTSDAGGDAVTMQAFKSAAKKAKKTHGEDWCQSVLEDAGVDVKSSLGRSISAVDEDAYQTIMDAWAEGPQDTSDDDDLEEEEEEEEDDFGDDEDEAEVDAEAVKKALKAYAKSEGRDEAKAIMTKHKIAALSGVDKMKPAAMAKLMKALV